jgi:hypothetical protein
LRSSVVALSWLRASMRSNPARKTRSTITGAASLLAAMSSLATVIDYDM